MSYQKVERGLKLPDMVESLCHNERERFMLPWSEASKVHVLSDLLQPCSFYIELPFSSMMCKREIFLPSLAVVTFQL